MAKMSPAMSSAPELIADAHPSLQTSATLFPDLRADKAEAVPANPPPSTRISVSIFFINYIPSNLFYGLK
jgi:hypothetical protein